MLLCHAREASKGVGSPEINANNHPFVSEDMKIGLIHNGRIPDNIYFELKKQYEVKSQCDSEIFLRMFDSKDIEIDNDVSLEDRIESIKKIWEKNLESHFAIAIGERLDKEYRLWIFRNEHRSLFKIDCTADLGQIFFVSTEEIWNDSNVFSVKGEIEEIITEQIYCFTLFQNDINSLMFHI